MPTEFTLVSWNIFQGLHHTTGRRKWKRNPEIEDHLRSLDADVLVLPEAWRIDDPDCTWAAELAESMGYELHEWMSDRPSRPRERVKFRMVIMTRIPATRLPDHVMPRFAPFAQRAIVRVELESGVRISGCHLYGIHLLKRGLAKGWVTERSELRAVSEMSDVVAGDMNMWSPVVHRDTPTLRPALTARTFSTPHPHSQIDHVLVSDRIEIVRSARLPDMGSDHLAISTTLRLR